MKKIILFLNILILLTTACTQSPILLKGEIHDFEANQLYLYDVNDEFYNNVDLIDSIPVIDGSFTYNIDSIESKLYFIALQNGKQENIQQGAYLFIEPTNMQISISSDKYNRMQVKGEGSKLEDKYLAFCEQKEAKGNRVLLDSLDALFYAAREKGDREEMKRIKELSSPYYDESREQKQQFIKEAIEKEKGTLFGLYLYFSNQFQHSTFSTLEEINKVRNFISEFDSTAKSSSYYTRIEKGLQRFERCAVGNKAPDIAGFDTNNNPLSLSNFKGKYVLIDFWSSGCGWCRKETPYLLEAFNKYKNNNFTILGVSSDYHKNDWLKAIEEDKSFWDHLLIPKDSIRTIMNKYCIIGIPHILLIDPEGKIIAKELRGDNISKTIAEYIK